MKEQELNKKLAEWAGFTSKKKWYHGGLRFQSYEYREWTAPDNSGKKLPNFPESLDACFKWLVPKFWVCDLTIEESIFALAKVGHPDIGTASHLEEIKDGKLLEAFALALCLAIEKLIDSKVASYESTADKWLKARCPICKLEYKYPEGGYEPSTCGEFECVHKFLHPEIYDLRFRKELDELKSERR